MKYDKSTLHDMRKCLMNMVQAVNSLTGGNECNIAVQERVLDQGIAWLNIVRDSVTVKEET